MACITGRRGAGDSGRVKRPVFSPCVMQASFYNHVRPMVISIAVLAGASLVMVLAMVRFAMALVDVTAPASARQNWGAVYLASWAAIVWALGSLHPDAGGSLWPVAALAASGWLGLNALWILLWVAIGRSQDAHGATTSLPPDADVLAASARAIASIAAVVLCWALWTIGAPQRLAAAVLEPDRVAASVAFTVAGAGFIAFMTGAVRMALGAGRPMTHAEIEDLDAAVKFGTTATGGRRGKVKLYGPAKGVSGEATFTFDEIARAWKSGAWRRDPQWISFSLMAVGALLTVGGAFAAALILGSATTRVVIAGFVAYTVIMAIRGRRAARR